MPVLMPLELEVMEHPPNRFAVLAFAKLLQSDFKTICALLSEAYEHKAKFFLTDMVF
jgi:hypothetical protein